MLLQRNRLFSTLFRLLIKDIQKVVSNSQKYSGILGALGRRCKTAVRYSNNNFKWCQNYWIIYVFYIWIHFPGLCCLREKNPISFNSSLGNILSIIVFHKWPQNSPEELILYITKKKMLPHISDISYRFYRSNIKFRIDPQSKCWKEC